MLQITGIMKSRLEPREGVSANGEWMTGGVVVEYGDEYTRKVVFTVFGREKVEQLEQLKVGAPVQVNFVPQSREFNGRWYTDLRATSIQQLVKVQPQHSDEKVQPQPSEDEEDIF